MAVLRPIWGQASDPGGASRTETYDLCGDLNVSQNPASPWVYIYRPTSKAWAEVMAQKMLEFVQNPYIRYSQDNRLTFWNQLKTTANYNISALRDCYCDCSSLTYACICLAAKEFRTNWTDYDYTGYVANQLDAFMNDTGVVTKIPYSDTTVRRGDILWRDRHCAICLSGQKDTTPTTSSAWGTVVINAGHSGQEQIPMTYHTYIYELSDDTHITPTPKLWRRADAYIRNNATWKISTPNIKQ